jgi:hypothetical protein
MQEKKFKKLKKKIKNWENFDLVRSTPNTVIKGEEALTF